MTDFDGFDEFADDLDEFADRMQEFRARIPEAVDTALRRTARQVRQDTSDNAPKDTNRLAESYHMEKLGEGKYSVGTDVEYAKPVEFGSEPHIIAPDTAEALKFTVDGETVYTSKVNHPGTRAQPYLRPAVREHSNYLTRQLQRELDKLAKEIFAR
jgi:HK97 gp10 family phage protein